MKTFEVDFESVNGSGRSSLRGAMRSTASALALSACLLPAAVFAQDADAVAEQEEEMPANAIVVSGIRQSLESAQNIKRDSDTIVDAITAEDIGALPDRSVTEALQRVPGVAINRFAGSNDPDHFSVEGSGVVIRGLNFVRSEFNGRTAFGAGVGGQALNFSDVPSELLGSVIINKNSTADLIEGGLAGTVNLNTRKPFDNNGLTVAFGAELNYGDFSEEWTPSFSGLISNTWDTEIGTFGLLVSGSFSRIRSRADGLQITNFQTRDNQLVERAFSGGTLVCRNPLPSGSDSTTLPPAGSACGQAGTPGADGFADYADLLYATIGGQFRTQEFDRRRDGQTIAAQWESIDGDTTITAEFIRSHSTNAWGEYTFETTPDLSEYSTYPFGCLQNDWPGEGPALLNPDGRGGFTPGDATNRAECPVGGFENYQYDENGLFQAGYITNPLSGWRGDPGTSPFVPIGGIQQSLSRRQVSEETLNKDYSLNFESQLTSRLHLNLDLHYAQSRKENLDFSAIGSQFSDQQLDLTGDLPVVTPRKPNYLSYPWAGDGAELAGATEQEYFNDPRFQFWRAAMDHIEDSEGDQYAVRADLDYDISDDSFIRSARVGARFQERDQTVRYTTYNWGALSEVWAGSRPVNFSDTNTFQASRYEFPNFFRGQVDGPPGALYFNGDLIEQYDNSVNFLQSVNQQWQDLGGNAGWVPLAGRDGAIAGTPYLPGDIQPVNQQDSAAYAMLRFGSENLFGGDMRIAGNVGVRYVNTQVRSEGNIGVGTNQALGIAQTFAQRCQTPVNLPDGSSVLPGGICLDGEASYLELQQFADGTSVPSVVDTSYDYWLPSLNVRFGVTDELILRFAASKVLTRPDNAYIRNFLTVGLDGTGNLTAQGGNPEIRPATAWQFDATAEWYFAPVGSLTLNLFYKDVENFFFQDVRSIEFTNNGITRDVLVRGPANFDGSGKIKGFELAYQQTYDFLPGLLSGLGVNANYTFIDSEGLPNTFLNGGLGNLDSSTVPTGSLPLEQLSRHNVNATVFYELGPITARAAYNWRSRFLLTASDVIFPYFSIFNEPTGQLDASLFVSLSDNIRVGVQGVNLLNEVTRTSQAYTGDPDLLAPRSYFMNDRRFSFILRGNF